MTIKKSKEGASPAAFTMSSVETIFLFDGPRFTELYPSNDFRRGVETLDIVKTRLKRTQRPRQNWIKSYNSKNS